MNKRFAAMLSLCAVSTVALAADDKIREGKWDYTVTMKMAGMPEMPKLPEGVQLPPGMKMPSISSNGITTSFQTCITNDKPVPQDDKGQQRCETTKMERKGNTVNYAVHCTDEQGGSIDGVGTATYTGDTMTSTMTLKGTSHGRPVDMTHTTTGKYLGPCT